MGHTKSPVRAGSEIFQVQILGADHNKVTHLKRMGVSVCISTFSQVFLGVKDILTHSFHMGIRRGRTRRGSVGGSLGSQRQVVCKHSQKGSHTWNRGCRKNCRVQKGCRHTGLKTIRPHEWRQVCGGADEGVISELCTSEVQIPVILMIVNITVQILLQCFNHDLRLTISLRVPGRGHALLSASELHKAAPK